MARSHGGRFDYVPVDSYIHTQSIIPTHIYVGILLYLFNDHASSSVIPVLLLHLLILCFVIGSPSDFVGRVANVRKLSRLGQGRAEVFKLYDRKNNLLFGASQFLLLSRGRCRLNAFLVPGGGKTFLLEKAKKQRFKVIFTRSSPADGDFQQHRQSSDREYKKFGANMKILPSRRILLGSLLRWTAGRRRDVLIALLNTLLIALVYRMLSAVGSHESDIFILYYQPCVPFLTMLWGWGLNVLYFERTGLRYDLCFDENDRHVLLSGHDILRLSNILTFGFMTSSFAFLAFVMKGSLSAAAMQPIILYVSALLVLVMPFPVLFRDTRKYFASTFWRVITPVRHITWADFLLADILTSLAKGFSDIERAVCSMVSGPILSGAPGQCTDASWTIPIGLALPYLWRLFQCIRIYIDTGNKQQLWNALKYMTAFPVVFFSFAKYHVSHGEWIALWKPLWLTAAFVNSSYSYFWDIERDWEISFFKNAMKGNPPLLPQPTQIPAKAYYYLMTSNLLLRLSWAYKLSPHLRRNHIVVFFIVLLEAFRRFQWIFVRVEVEMRKMQTLHPEMGTLVPGSGKFVGRRHVALPISKGNMSP